MQINDALSAWRLSWVRQGIEESTSVFKDTPDQNNLLFYNMLMR